MALTNILSTKELELGFQPLLLAEFEWPADRFGSQYFFRVCTHGLAATEGTVSYRNGADYYGRILRQEIAATQSMASAGIDMPPSVTLTLADADKYIFTNFEGPDGPGFRGAILRLRFTYYDPNPQPGQPSFASDDVQIFVGVCGPASFDQDTCTVQAISLLNMSLMSLPSLHIQKRCPWVHPDTHEQKLEANTIGSWFYQCGDTDEGHTSCARTKAACIANDKWDTNTGQGNYGGFQYESNPGWSGRAYGGGSEKHTDHEVSVVRYRDFVPLIYGWGWIDAPVINMVGDANYTRFEVLLCYGETILSSQTEWAIAPTKVIVNGHFIGFAKPGAEWADIKNGWWGYSSLGARTGQATYRLTGFKDNAGHPIGDPFGSMTVICVEVLRSVTESDAQPQVRALWRGARIPQFTLSEAQKQRTGGTPVPFLGWTGNAVTDGGHTETTGEYVYRGLPTPWVIMDILSWSNWDYMDLDLVSFYTAAEVKAKHLVTYKDQHGNNTFRRKYQCNLILRNPRGVPDILQGLLANCCAILRPGKYGLEILIKETLASQQPSRIDGSNDSNPHPSRLITGQWSNGYVAYHFDESNIKRDDMDRSTLRLVQQSLGDGPNTLGIAFQDQDNGYQIDSVEVVHAADVMRTGQRIPSAAAVDGICHYDQAYKVLATLLAERSMGNPLGVPGDTRGTWHFEFLTTARLIHLQVGDIVSFTSHDYGLTNQLFRVSLIQPSTDFSEAFLRISWHEDAWYLDDFGEDDLPTYTYGGRQKEDRAPYKWQAYDTPDPISGGFTFGLIPHYLRQAGFTDVTTGSAVWGMVKLSGYLPVNNLCSPGVTVPYLPPGALSRISGDFPAKTYYVGVVALVNETGQKKSTPVPTRNIEYITLTTAGGIEIAGIVWDADTVGWQVYAGLDPMKGLSFQKEGTGTPSSILIQVSESIIRILPNDTVVVEKQLPRETFGLPDTQFQILEALAKRVYHSGVWGQPVDAVDGDKLSIGEAGWTTNQWRNRRLAILGDTDGQLSATKLAVREYIVASNTDDTLTLKNFDGTAANLEADGVGQNDAAIMRTRCEVVDPVNFSIRDTQWANTLAEPQYIETVSSDETGQSDLMVLGVPGHGFKDGDHIRIFSAIGPTGIIGATEYDMLNGLWEVDGTSEFFGLNFLTLREINPASPLHPHGTFDRIDPYTGNSGFIQIYGLRPNASIDQGEEVGRLVRIIGGTGTGQLLRIIGNDIDTVYVEPWRVEPDRSSVFIIEDPAWISVAKTDKIDNWMRPNDPDSTKVEMQLDMSSFFGQVALIQVDSIDDSQRRSVESPYREVFIYPYSGALGEEFTDKMTFGIGIGADQEPEDYIGNHGHVRSNGTVIEITARQKIHNGTADTVLRIDKSNDSGLNWTTVASNIRIPNGNTTLLTFTDFADPPDRDVHVDDIMAISLVSGLATNVELVVIWQRTDMPLDLGDGLPPLP